MNAGGNMVFMGWGLSAGGNASLTAGGDLLLAYDTGKQVRAQSPLQTGVFSDMDGHLKDWCDSSKTS